ncbi:MAG: hypothetical protein ACRDXB_05075 [Actinomycetes bacterium]
MGFQVTEVQKSLKGAREVRIFKSSGGAMTRSTPDPLGHDDDVLTQSETLDEDDMGVDPLEGGMDPADGWAASDRYGTTAVEQATDRPLTDRLEEERPDINIASVPDRPIAATPLEELDESIDDEVVPAGPEHGRGQVLVGDEVDSTGESATRRSGYLITEPDQPAADEAVYVREE